MLRTLAPRASLVLGLAATLLLAAGCAPAARKSNSLVVWSQMDPDEKARFEQNITAFEAAHPGVKIQNNQYNTEDLRQQFQNAAAAGRGPQIIFGPSDQIGPLSMTQVIQPLDHVMPAGYFDQFLPQSIDTLNGKIWAAPDQLGNHLMLCFNRKLVPVAPKTSEEFLAIAKKLTHGDQYGFAMNTNEPYWLIPFLTGFGGWVMDANRQPTLDTPAMVQALDYVARLGLRDKVMPPSCGYENAMTMFQDGKAAMTINGPWSFAAYRAKGIDLGVAPIWSMPGGGISRPMTGSKGYSVSVNVQKDELPLVVEFIQFCTSADAELRDATRISVLPSRRDAFDSPQIQQDSTLSVSREAVSLGRRMPVVPELRIIWDRMRPSMQQVMNGKETPAAAAKEMQAGAVKLIGEMHR